MATVPTVPLIVVRPKCTNQTLEFYWLPPTSDGGSPITGYTLTDGTLTYNITGNPGYYKVTGLTNGQTYSFTLAASNAIGLGPAASFRSVEPGSKPQPPASVSYTDQGSGNVLVNWTNPADIGGTSRLLGMLVRSFRVDSENNVNFSSLSTVNTLWGGNASVSYSYPFYSLSETNNWLFQVQLQNDPGRTVRTVGFTSTFISVVPDFSPSTVSTLQLWLDASFANSLTISSVSTVTQWRDLSPLSNSTDSITGTPALASNYLASKNAVFFNGSSYFSGPLTNTQSTLTAFVVTALTAGGVQFPRIFSMGVSNSNDFDSALRVIPFYYTATSNFATFRNGILGQFGGIATPSTFLGTVTYTGTSTLFQYNASTPFLSSSSGLFSTTRYGLGKDPGLDTQILRGHICELVYFQSTLGTLQRQTMEGYLAWKWGISTLLPSWHPFYYRKPLPSDSNLDFSPSSLGGTQVWLDAADATTIVRSGTTSTMVTWTDKSGLGNNATAVNNPQYLPTDNSIVFNSGSSQYFTLSNGALPFSNSSYSYYFIAQFSNTNAGGVIGGGAAANNSSYNIRPDNGNIRNYWYFNDIVTQNSFTINTKAAITSYYSTTSIRALSLNYQSTVQDTPTARTQPSTNNTVGRTVANEYLSGRIHEILVFSTFHSAVDRQRIEGYLAWKWGNQNFLPPSHLYALRPPTRLDTFSTVGTSTILGPIASS